MEPFAEFILEYKNQLEKGAIQKAYRGLMEYMLALKTHLKTSYPDYIVSGSLYPGYMDMTYFAFTPPSLKPRSLKIAIVLLHEPLHFEAWLSGSNRQVQVEYWNLFKSRGLKQYRLVTNPLADDAILEHTLLADPDFHELDALTEKIEGGTLKFIEDVERSILQLENRFDRK